MQGFEDFCAISFSLDLLTTLQASTDNWEYSTCTFLDIEKNVFFHLGLFYNPSFWWIKSRELHFRRKI